MRHLPASTVSTIVVTVPNRSVARRRHLAELPGVGGIGCDGHHPIGVVAMKHLGEVGGVPRADDDPVPVAHQYLDDLAAVGSVGVEDDDHILVRVRVDLHASIEPAIPGTRM